jgi:hypothetical protein
MATVALYLGETNLELYREERRNGGGAGMF